MEFSAWSEQYNNYFYYFEDTKHWPEHLFLNTFTAIFPDEIKSYEDYRKYYSI